MSEPVRLIKKYPNRRLYDTRTSSYITLADVKQLVLKQERFQVVDAKSGEDLTRAILLQIILEEESNGAPLLSHDVLTQFIRSYGGTMQAFMSNCLERNVQLFAEMQKNFQEQSRQAYGDPLKAGQEMFNQMLSMQAPAMQNLMATYMEQSRAMFEQIQQQMQSQGKNFFGTFPFAGFNPPGAAESETKKDEPQRG
jgi:polyhydroxyalkanoate synthesis repressor PhaR